MEEVGEREMNELGDRERGLAERLLRDSSKEELAKRLAVEISVNWSRREKIQQLEKSLFNWKQICGALIIFGAPILVEIVC